MGRRDELLHQAILQTNFETFLHQCFKTINPNIQYLDNWHIWAVAYQLDRLQRGEIKRLAVNLPPRTLKSLEVSVAFPAFVLGHDPSRRIFLATYGTELSRALMRDFRRIVESEWYQTV